MATFYRVLEVSKDSAIPRRINDKKIIAEDARVLEYFAAVRIQSWYRKLKTISYLKHLDKCAVIIQKTWRGYLGRKYCRIRVRNLLMIMRFNYYNKMAVIVQKRWRGFYVRLRVHNFYARKRYFKALEIKNEIVRHELSAIKEQLSYEASYRQREKSERSLNELACDSHHLISTTVMRGVYNSPFKEVPDEMELRLKAMFHLDYLDNKHRKPRRKVVLRNKSDRHLPRSLPDFQQPQGPFKPIYEVRKLRYKPFRPRFRLHDEDDLKAARERLQIEEDSKDIHGVPFRSFRFYDPPYISLVHTQSDYSALKKFVLREDDPSKNISKKPMKTVLSSMAFFGWLDD